MTMTIMMAMVLSMLIFIQLNHPLSMTMNIIVHTLLMCLMTGHLSPTFWFSYILFMIFIGGMLVLFLYITSLASNELFSASILLLILVPMMFSMTFLLLIPDPLIPNLYMYTNDILYSNDWLNNLIQMILMKIYNYPTHFITIMLVFYLLLALIAIVKIINILKGPLRKMD
uniref:NADH-ubiquinone oxidoreductase chain 6 n=2 Tax=Gryllotalpa TaxID=208679 RepID=A0A0U1VVP6_GRYUN|nr:NADH dehydrogenase subunit 6 [Gryllotalpa unispina]AGO20455.1 NADH dehydrogenase subunit 6 [Gryllotalpa unispina]